MNEVARDPWIISEPAPQYNESGLEMLYNVEIRPDRWIRRKPDWEQLRARAKTLQNEDRVGAPEVSDIERAQEELKTFGFVVLNKSNNREATTGPQFASGLWARVGPGGVPGPPPLPEGGIVGGYEGSPVEPPADPANGDVMTDVTVDHSDGGSDGGDSYMHASQDSAWSDAASTSSRTGRDASRDAAASALLGRPVYLDRTRTWRRGSPM